MKDQAANRPATLMIGGIPTLCATRAELAAMMVADVALARSKALGAPRIVTSSNGSVIANFHRDSEFRQIMLQADIIDADGMPLVFASRVFCKSPLTERTATTDFIHDAATAAAAEGIRFYLLGSTADTVHAAREKLIARHHGLQIVGARSGYFDPHEEERLCAEVVEAGTDVLWVGMGSPRQEAFALRNRHRLQGVAWIRTCGGLFDHMAERFARAPSWVQSAGMEWAFRAWQEPRRLGPRYLMTNPVAAYHLLTKTHD